MMAKIYITVIHVRFGVFIFYDKCAYKVASIYSTASLSRKVVVLQKI